jgi:hypothetical protein
MKQRAPANATIAVTVVPPPVALPKARVVSKARRASDQPTIVAEALPSQQHTVAVPALPSQQHTVAVPALPRDDDEAIAKGLTVVPTAKTLFAHESSCELPFSAEIVFEPGPPLPPRRKITLGEGVLERVPQRRAWFLPAIVAVTTVAAALIVVVAS